MQEREQSCPTCSAAVLVTDQGTFCRSTGVRTDRPDLHASLDEYRATQQAERDAAAAAVRAERDRRRARAAAVAGTWNARALGIIR
jgi:hypothetical protein